MAAPLFATASTGRAVTQTTVAVAKPVGTAADEWLLAFAVTDRQSIDAPAGFTVLSSGSTSGNNPLAWVVARKRTGGSEPASYTFTAGSSGTLSAALLRYTDGHPTDPFVVSAPVTDANGNPVRAASVLTVADESRVVGLFGAQLLNGEFSPPVGTTERASLDNPLGNYSVALLAVDYEQVTAGATGERNTGESPLNTGWVGVQVAIRRYNDPPYAPTVSVPAQVPTTSPTVVTLGFQDPNDGDTASQSLIRVRRTDVTPVPAWTIYSRTGTTTTVTIPADALVAAPYEVQGANRDALGEPVLDSALAWSPSAYFTAAVPPPGPTISSPANGATIPSSSVTATVSAVNLDELLYRVLGDLNGAPNEANVLMPEVTLTGPAAQARQFTVTGLPNNTTVHLQARVRYQGLLSPRASSSNPVSFTPPPTPTATPTAVPATVRVNVAVTNPAPSGSQPAVTHNDLHRRPAGSTEPISAANRIVTGTGPNGTAVDRTPGADLSGSIGYEYAVRAHAANGTHADSAWAG